jgi:hypothetical protein
MTDRTPVFHLDTLNFSAIIKKKFYWPPNLKLYGEPTLCLYCNNHAVDEQGRHSGTISSKQLDIKNYFFPFFSSYMFICNYLMTF